VIELSSFSPLIPRFRSALARGSVGPMNPLLTKEGEGGGRVAATFPTSPGPSLVRRGTLPHIVRRPPASWFIGSSTGRRCGAACRGETGVSAKRGQPLDTAPEKMGPTRGERLEVWKGFPNRSPRVPARFFGPVYRGARSGHRRLFLSTPHLFRGGIEGPATFIDSPPQPEKHSPSGNGYRSQRETCPTSTRSMRCSKP
jgi:hypothetical protein